MKWMEGKRARKKNRPIFLNNMLKNFKMPQLLSKFFLFFFTRFYYSKHLGDKSRRRQTKNR